MRRRAPLLVLLAVVIGGFALAISADKDTVSVERSPGATSQGLPPGHPPILEPDPPARAERVIRAWADALRAGKVRRAAGYFALPSLAENGTPPLPLRTRDDTIAFNESLPCGARLLDTETDGRFTTATFRLTERPGGRCGPGTGGEARTTFVIAKGRIQEWRRVGAEAEPSGPVV